MGSGGCIPATPGVPGRAARGHARSRHPPGVRRGDDQQALLGRAAEAARRDAGPHHARQVHGRRHELWRFRRARRRDGPVRRPSPRRAHSLRHLQQQRHVDGRRRWSPWARSSTRPRPTRCSRAARALRERLNAICRERGVEMHFSGSGSMMQPHFRKGPIERPYAATPKEEALRELYFFDLLAAGHLHCAARDDRDEPADRRGRV